jgi:hypothetical protein
LETPGEPKAAAELKYKKETTMRKIIYHTLMNPETFQPYAKVIQKTADGEIIVLFNEPLENAVSKYTLEEQSKIDFCNKVLVNNGQEHLVEDEIEFMLDPSGIAQRLDSLAKGMEDPEVLQRMAGFSVEKTVSYTKE